MASDDLVFGFPTDVMTSVGEYFNYSMPALSALSEERYYECATVCAVLLDVIMNDILDNLPSEFSNGLRERPAGAIIHALEKEYSNAREAGILGELRALNRLRIRVVHPGSEDWKTRISPDNCPKEFAEEFFDRLETVVDLFGGYSNRQFGEDFEIFRQRWGGVSRRGDKPGER